MIDYNKESKVARRKSPSVYHSIIVYAICIYHVFYNKMTCMYMFHQISFSRWTMRCCLCHQSCDCSLGRKFYIRRNTGGDKGYSWEQPAQTMPSIRKWRQRDNFHYWGHHDRGNYHHFQAKVAATPNDKKLQDFWIFRGLCGCCCRRLLPEVSWPEL